MTTKCINHRAGHVSDGHGVCAYCGATLTKKAVVTDNPTLGPHRQYGQFVTDTSDTLGGMFVIRTTADAGSEFLGAAHGRDVISRAEMALDADGRVLALRVHVTDLDARFGLTEQFLAAALEALAHGADEGDALGAGRAGDDVRLHVDGVAGIELAVDVGGDGLHVARAVVDCLAGGGAHRAPFLRRR